MATESSTKLTLKESVENQVNNLFIGNQKCKALYEILNICNQKEQKRFNIYLGKTPIQTNDKSNILYYVIPYLYGNNDDAGQWTFFGSGSQAIQKPEYYSNMTSYHYSGSKFDTNYFNVNIISTSGAKGKIISQKTLPKNPNTTYFKVVNNALEYDFSSIICTGTDGSDSNIVSINKIFTNSQLNTSSTVGCGNYHKHTFDLISNESNKSIAKINYYVRCFAGSSGGGDSGSTIWVTLSGVGTGSNHPKGTGSQGTKFHMVILNNSKTEVGITFFTIPKFGETFTISSNICDDGLPGVNRISISPNPFKATDNITVTVS